jgi:hypothetical protein
MGKSKNSALSFYLNVITEDFVTSLLKGSGVVRRNGIFQSSITIWLMLAQRFYEDISMAKVITQLQKYTEWEALLERASSSKRARSKEISNNTGGYSQARKKLPLDVVIGVADKLNEEAIKATKRSTNKYSDIYVIDGSTFLIEHTNDNLKKYPVSTNQHGKAHYPLVRFVVATNVDTGLALRPSCGPYSGDGAVSEHSLSCSLLPRLPNGSTVVGDRCYGTYRFVREAKKNILEVLVRLRKTAVSSLLKNIKGEVGEQSIIWKPTKYSLKKFPELSEDEGIPGRLIWIPIPGRRGNNKPVMIFTTTSKTIKEVAQIYALRWYVETDLRNIKSTLKLDKIQAQSPEMVEKELILAISAYNLVRLFIGVIAHKQKLNCREISFTRVLYQLQAMACSEGTQASPSFIDSVTNLSGLLISKRKKKRQSEPRLVWPKGRTPYYTTKTSRKEKMQEIEAKQSLTK